MITVRIDMLWCCFLEVRQILIVKLTSWEILKGLNDDVVGNISCIVSHYQSNDYVRCASVLCDK